MCCVHAWVFVFAIVPDHNHVKFDQTRMWEIAKIAHMTFVFIIPNELEMFIKSTDKNSSWQTQQIQHNGAFWGYGRAYFLA